MDIAIALAFAIYLSILIGIGIAFYRTNKNAEDFMIGGRSINYFVTAIATQAGDMSSWLFLGFPGTLFIGGMFKAWTAIGLVFFMFLLWQFIAPKLRVATEKYESLSLASYFNKRFNDTSGLLGILSALICIIYFTFYISSGLVGLGRLFESAFEINYHTGIIIALGAAVMYTLIGGFIAVAWGDLFQGLFLLCMIVLVPAYAITQLPHGWTSVVEAANLKNISLSLWPSSFSAFLSMLVLTLGFGLGYFGQPHVLVNFMGIDDVKKMRYAKYVGLTWQIIVLTAAALIGLISIAYFADTTINPDLIFIAMTKSMFPPLLTGFVLCGILAATLSTMDRQILISGSTFAEDIYTKLINPHASSVHLMWLSRAASLVFSGFALALAFNNSNSIYDLVLYAWSGLGSAFGPLVIGSLYWPRATRQGALASILVGSITAGIWPYFSTLQPMIPGFGLSMLALIFVSLATKNNQGKKICL